MVPVAEAPTARETRTLRVRRWTRTSINSAPNGTLDQVFAEVTASHHRAPIIGTPLRSFNSASGGGPLGVFPASIPTTPPIRESDRAIVSVIPSGKPSRPDANMGVDGSRPCSGLLASAVAADASLLWISAYGVATALLMLGELVLPPATGEGSSQRSPTSPLIQIAIPLYTVDRTRS